jgi:hypothetical protein
LHALNTKLGQVEISTLTFTPQNAKFIAICNNVRKSVLNWRRSSRFEKRYLYVPNYLIIIFAIAFEQTKLENSNFNAIVYLE